MDPATWPLIGDVIRLFSGAADKLIPDRNQRFSMSVEAATGNIRAELGGQGWLSGNWRAMVCLSGYVLNRETIQNISEFLKSLREQKPKEK